MPVRYWAHAGDTPVLSQETSRNVRGVTAFSAERKIHESRRQLTASSPDKRDATRKKWHNPEQRVGTAVGVKMDLPRPLVPSPTDTDNRLINILCNKSTQADKSAINVLPATNRPGPATFRRLHKIAGTRTTRLNEQLQLQLRLANLDDGNTP